MKKAAKITLCASLLMSIMMPLFSYAEAEMRERLRAEVVEVVHEESKEIPTFTGAITKGKEQDIRVEILEGTHKGEEVEIANDFFMLKEGDKLFIDRMEDETGRITYQFEAPDRRAPLLVVVILFIATVLAFGGREGVRALLALCGSLFALGVILIPGLLGGASPVLISSLISLAILVLAILITHGFNRISLVAILGTGGTVILAAILAIWGIHAAHLSGITDDVSVYLNIQKGGSLDFSGLLLGSIIIGMLGALTESAITQVLVVQELFAAGVKLSHVYTRAMKVGRAHVGALVNTLALAYVGSGLPMLLYFWGTDSPSIVANNEIFATEIIRTMVGSIAVVFAVPLTTIIAVYLLRNTPVGSHVEHSHGHNHA